MGVPILVGVGYAHYKKTPSYRAETDVWMESNPYQARVLLNSQFSVNLNLKMIKMIAKISKNEKITDKEIEEMLELQEKIENHITKRTLSNKDDKEKEDKIVSDKDIREALIFNKNLFLENIIIPNRLKIPISRNILENYYN